MTTTDTARPPAALQLLEGFVRSRIGGLQARLAAGDSSARGALARMRRAAGSDLEEHPEAWGDFLDGFPAELTGIDDEVSSFEQAAYVALTLFALHQQGHAQPMHSSGPGGRLGAAVRTMAAPTDPEEYEKAALRRFQVLVTADEFSEILHHLRGTVLQLKDRSIPLDYGRLAADLAVLQRPQRATRVKLQWARDLYTAPRNRQKSSSSGDHPTAATHQE